MSINFREIQEDKVRFDLEIAEAKENLRKFEQYVKKTLIENNCTECLQINWNLIRKYTKYE